MKHCDAMSGAADTPTFDAPVAEEGKNEAFYLKHTRLSREEAEKKGTTGDGQKGRKGGRNTPAKEGE